MEVLSGALFSFCTLATAYLFFEVFLEPNPRWKPVYNILYIIALGVVHNLAGQTIETELPFYSVGRIALSIARTLVLSFLASLALQGGIKKKIGLTFLFFLVGFAPELPSIGLYRILTQQPSAQPEEALTKFSASILAFMLTFLTVAIIRFFRQRSRTVAGKHLYWQELIIPLVSLASVCYSVSLQSFEAVDIGLFVLTINILAFWVYSLYSQKTRAYDLMAQEHRFREIHYQALERHQSEIRAIKHDMKNQLIAMGAYVTSGDSARADEQLGQLIRQLEESGKLFFTDNAGINGLLSRKYREAQQDGIQCDFQVSLPAVTGFADTDLAALLGNLLDNALEACRRFHGRRYIGLEILSGDDVLIIRSENSTDGKVQTMRTRKKDTLRHGIGMESIQQVVNRYNGQMQYRFQQDRFHIELSLFPPSRALGK